MPEPIYGQWIVVLLEARDPGRFYTEVKATQRRDLPPSKNPDAWLRIPPPPWLEAK